MHYCPNCGKPLEDREATSCPYCGYKLMSRVKPKKREVDDKASVANSKRQMAHPKFDKRPRHTESPISKEPINVAPSEDPNQNDLHTRSKRNWLGSVLLVVAILAVTFVNVQYKQYRQNKVNNNPLSAQKITFERFGINDFDVSNATYQQELGKIYAVMVKNSGFSQESEPKVLRYVIDENDSNYNQMQKALNSKDKSKIKSFIKDTDVVYNQENIFKIKGKIRKEKKVQVSLNLPKTITEKYHINLIPRKVTVNRIINQDYEEYQAK